MTTGRTVEMNLSKQISWRRPALCLACVALVFAAGCSDRRSEQYRGEGDTQLLQLENIDKARLAYENALKANPENARAYLGLARCAAADGDSEAALTSYEQARSYDPALDEAFMEPVWILVENNRLDDAIALAQTYSEVSAEKGGRLLAVVQLKNNQVAEATALLESLREDFPDSPEVKLSLGVALSEGGRSEEAIALLKELARGNSTVAPAAQSALIEVSMGAGQVEELLAEFESLVAQKPDDNLVKMGYARSLLLAGRYEEAESAARTVLDIEPKSGWANYIVGVSKLSEGNAEEAVAFLESAAAVLPEETEVAEMLAAAREGKMPEATEEATSEAIAENTSVSAPGAWRELWQQAALRRMLDNRQSYLASNESEVREYLAMAALFMRDFDLAQELVAALPEDSKVAGFFKVMEARDGENSAKFFEDWRPEDPALELLRDNALAYAMAATGSRGQALSVLLFCLERWPDNAVSLFNIAQVFQALNQPEIAAQQLQRIIGLYPENIDAHQMLYAALRQGGAMDRARKAAEFSFNLFPEEKWCFINLAESYAETGDLELAMQVLDRGKSLYPADPEIVLATSGVLVRLGDCDRAAEILGGLTTTAVPIRARRALFEALCAAQAGDWGKVTSSSASLDSANWPDSLALLASAAELAAGNQEAARQALTPRNPETPVAGNLGQILLVALGGSQELGEDESQWANALGSDLELCRNYIVMAALQRSGLNDAAWTYFEENFNASAPHIAVAQLAFGALAKADTLDDAESRGMAIAESLKDDSRAWLGFSELLRETGDTEGQTMAIAKAVEVGPENPDAWFRQAILQEKEGNLEGAVESYRRLLELQPESPAANNNLAYMLLRVGGQDEEALEKAQTAKEKMPTNPGVLHTLGLAQLRTGNLEESKKTLFMASEIDPANPTIMYDYGRVLLELGETDSAKQRLRYALGMSQRAGLEFPEQADAESLLGTLD